MAGVQRRNRYADESGFNSDEILSEDVGEGEISVEEAFKDEEVPTWRQQLTVRSLFTCLVLSVVFNFIVCKLNLTTGVIPSLNAAAGLLGFAILKSYTSLLSKFGFLKQPFSRQENTVIQTCIVASSGIAFSSGTASYMLGMSPYIAGQEDEGNSSVNEKSLSIGWMIGFLFAVSFVGLFSIVPLRKQMILKYKLTYPSGTATAFLINSFHTPKGAALAKNQVTVLFKAFGGSFIWAFFQWFFAAGDDCGFVSFPTFGLQAYKQKKGDWYSADLSPSSLHGIQGYRVFIAIATMLGDGLFQLMQDFKTGYLTLSSPRAMFFSQIFGTALGCIISPPVFWFFYKAYPIGKPDGPYPAPYGQLYRGIALLGVEGVSSLPRNCAYLSIGFFLMAMAINSVKEFLKAREYRVHKFIPSPMCMAIPFYLGAYFGIDMCVGSLIVFVWSLYNKKQAKEYSPAVASGMICGDSLWGIPAAILSMAGVGAPICMKFLSAGANKKVDALLAG
ncbi:Probable metal-nicotianamine transporter YSL7 [Linum perenne]